MSYGRTLTEFARQPGALERLRRDGGSDRRDIDVIRENHRFLWEAEDEAGADVTWGRRLARKYYDKLFKEYAICDLRRYQENKVRHFVSKLWFSSFRLSFNLTFQATLKYSQNTGSVCCYLHWT